MKNEFTPSIEQKRIFDFDGKNMVVSASAGSGKTTTMIEYISRLIENGQPLKRMLVLTFTKAAATEMKERLLLSLIKRSDDERMQSQIDDLFVSDISTIHSFLEKIIKRNIGQIAFLEGFNLIDERQGATLQNEAYSAAEQKFKEKKHEQYISLKMAMRDNNLLNNIIFKIHDYLSAQANKKQLIASFRNTDKIFDSAQEYLFNKLKSMQNDIAEKVDLFPQDNEKVTAYLGQLKILTNVAGENLREVSQTLADLVLPRQCTLTGYDKRDDVLSIKLAAQNIIKFAKKLNPSEDVVWDKEKLKNLCNSIFDLYEFFDEQYSIVKQRANALDFDDLEKFAEQLLEDENILKELQDRFDYVFIDEYQDTNPVQEKIIKAISGKCKFIAIGDPKQGIYAFRNATSKIILKDSEDFEKASDGATEYLSSNYRSDKKILEFVNHVFSSIMTLKTSGIDYKKSSYLKGEKQNPKTNDPAVEILVAQKPKRTRPSPCEDYDIYSDELCAQQSGQLEAQIVAEKIERFLASEFVDPKTNERRRVQPSDIALLSRSKSDVCDGIMNELRKRGIPFVSTLKTDLSSKAHTLLVVNLLSLCVGLKDDVALASYLYSPLCLIDLNTLALLEGEGSFAQKVLNSKNAEIVKALNRLKEFKRDCMFLGAKKALEKLFIEKEFFVYLKMEIGENAVAEMLSLLSAIEGFENDKDIPSLIDYLKSPITFSSVSGQNAINISSIHGSKGLEYPIVFVVGLGKNILRSEQEQFKLDEEFGLSLMAMDEEKMEKFASLPLVAARDIFNDKERRNELMVLYVALTRAKSHLVLSGTADLDDVIDFDEGNFKNYSSFLSLILSTNPQKAGAAISNIDEVEDVRVVSQKVTPNIDEKDLSNALNSYLNFVYPYQEETKLKQKSSVTMLSHEGEEFSAANGDLALVGTAYHEALRVLDFDKVKKLEDVENFLNENNFDENYKKLIKNEIIFENIQLIKPLIENKKIIKEKQFTMRLNLNSGARLVQGTVDLFLKGDKNILIDYKLTAEKDEKIILNRYKKQLELYKEAIENAENIKVDEIYILSLKNKKIIKY